MISNDNQVQSTKSANSHPRMEDANQDHLEDLTELSTEDLLHMIHELHVRQFELEMQNEELHSGQGELKKARDNYAELYDFAPACYFRVATNDEILDVNRTGADLLAATSSLLIGKSLSCFITRDSQDQFYSHCRQVFETKDRLTCELRMVKQDGTLFHAQLNSIFVQDIDGTCDCCFFFVVTDITGRIQADEALRKTHDDLEMRITELTAELSESNALLKQQSAELTRSAEALRRSEAKYRVLAESTAAATSVHQDTRISYVNLAPDAVTDDKPDELVVMNFWDVIPDSKFCLSRDGKILDYELAADDHLLSEILDETIIGRKLNDTLPPDLVNLTMHYIEQTFVTDTMQVFEYQLPSLLGTEDFETRLLVCGQNEVLAIVRNISEPKRVEQQAIQVKRLAALGRLTATLAHEFSNPLQSIQNHLELILDFPVKPGASEKYLQTIRRDVERLSNVAQHVLDYAQPKLMPRQPVFVADFVQRVLDTEGKRLQNSGIQVTTDFQDTPPALAVPDHLIQIFLNLLINATEAVTEDGQLHISIYPDGYYVAVSFSNKCPPIPPEILSRIFEPFFTTKPDGSGLGLWISHVLVQQQGGLLTVRNVDEFQRVVVTVQLPVVR